MKKRSSCLWIFVLLLSVSQSIASDSLHVLDRDQFLCIVRTYHPVVLQADFQVNRADAGIMEARGAFDPNISATLDQKSIDGKQYYNYFNPQLSIPTWYGLSFKAGLEEVYGDRINPERTPGQSSYAGVKLAANELIFDQRRAVLRQAQGIKQLNEAERKLAINDLMFDAMVAYLEWLQTYQNYKLFSDIVKVNEERLQFIRIEFEQGSRPAIDTIEALAQLQTFKQQQLQAHVAWQNSGINLSTFLWGAGLQPFSWNTDIVPDTLMLTNEGRRSDAVFLLKAANSDLFNHPKIEALRSKIFIQETERRLKAQSFIPKLALDANLLNKGYAAPNEVSFPMLQNNYKMGVGVQIPLLFRAARGAYRASQLKIAEIKTDLDYTLIGLQNKLNAYINEARSLDLQLREYNAAYLNYYRLYQGERLKFTVGEGTLFLLNTRETKLFEARQKQIELEVKWQKALAAASWASASFVTM